MNFLEAVKAMKEGKKVKRNHWEDRGYVQIDELGNLIGDDDEGWVFNERSIEATDWEIVEKKKTLSDESNDSYRVVDLDDRPFYYEDDVKEAIKKFIDWCESDDWLNDENHKGLTAKTKEIFGERLSN